MKSTVGKLLAVVTIATAAPAAADTVKDPWSVTPVTGFPQNMPAQFRGVQAQLLIDGVLMATVGVTVPRQLRSGAPACGNVQTKSPQRCEEPEGPAPVITAQMETK